ncbi:hypothetical protein [Clostridium sp. Marseille-P2415]|uniref:hypothetical protein n=1 Tax=Clostridium sp. Marseille-P2415 TaxID=1805471 RepID=UPI00190E6E86|nr:hypothetical protein [Clostridium sp. Marseille-P2415]
MEEDLNTPKIIRAVLIDDRRIELYWNTQIQGAYDERSFAVRYHGEIRKLTHWTKDKEWDYGTVYQKESMRTTLCLEEPVNPALAGKLTVQVTGNMADLMDCPVNREIIYQVTYEAYYTQFLICGSGVTVKAGKTVSQKTMKLAASIIDIMLEKIPEAAEVLVKKKAELAIFGLKENAYDIPEHRQGYLLATRPVAGFGGDKNNPVSSISEANVIRLRSGRYATRYSHEMILVHEYGHAIHLVGINALEDRSLAEQVKNAYKHAKDSGLWPHTYAISNYEEYFATLGTVWFNVMQEGVDGRWDGIRGPVNTREELYIYDPEGYELMKRIYPEKTLPAPWNNNRDAYNIDGSPRLYDIGKEFAWDFIQ